MFIDMEDSHNIVEYNVQKCIKEYTWYNSFIKKFKMSLLRPEWIYFEISVVVFVEIWVIR